MRNVHYFALLEQRAYGSTCDEWRDGDTWTTLPSKVTCHKCVVLLTLSDPNTAQNTDRIEPLSD